MPLREHAGRHFAVQFHYALPDNAWSVELSEAVSAPVSWADIPGSPSHLPGPATAAVPDLICRHFTVATRNTRADAGLEIMRLRR